MMNAAKDDEADASKVVGGCMSGFACFNRELLTFLFIFCSSGLISAQHASSRLDSLANYARMHNTDTLGVIGFADLCYEYRFIQQDSALKFARQGIDLAKKLKFKPGLAQLYSDAAFVHYDRGHFDSAAMFWDSALQLRTELKDTTRIASLHLKIGAVSFRKGDYPDALHHYLTALRMYEKLEVTGGVAQALNNAAAVYQHQNDLENALKYYQQAYMLHSEASQPTEAGTTLINIGNIHFLEKNYKDARRDYIQALKLLKERGLPTNKSIALNNLSELYTIEGRYDSAAWYSEEALKLRRESGDAVGIISSLNMTGRIQMKLKNYASAENYFNDALDLAIRGKMISEQGRVYKNLHELYSELGQWKKSLDAHMHYASLQDSILNESSRKEVAALHVQYESEKKEQQISLQEAMLAQREARIERDATIIVALALALVLLLIIALLLRNRHRRKTELQHHKNEIALREAYIKATIESQELERMRFAKDLHDGIGQWISALQMCLSEIQGARDDEQKLKVLERSDRLMKDINTEFRSIAFNLMPQTLIRYGLPAALSEMVKRLNSVGQPVFSANTFEFPERLHELAEISLYRVVQEWTTNILKHSDATRIEIQLTGHDDELIVLVEDNGSGFRVEDLHNGSGNGWDNMRSRISLIKGSIDIDSTPGRQGTTFTVRIPKQNTVYEPEVTGHSMGRLP